MQIQIRNYLKTKMPYWENPPVKNGKIDPLEIERRKAAMRAYKRDVLKERPWSPAQQSVYLRTIIPHKICLSRNNYFLFMEGDNGRA